MLDLDFLTSFSDKVEQRLFDYTDKQDIPLLNPGWQKLAKNWEWLSDKNNYCLPYNWSRTTNVISIDTWYFHITTNSFNQRHPNVLKKSVEDEIARKCNGDFFDDVQTCVTQIMSSLYFDYLKCLETTISIDNFQGIRDEKLILVNHYNLYADLKESDEFQLQPFLGIQIDNPLSNILLNFLLEFIEHRLDLLDPKLRSKNPTGIKSRKTKKLVWNGGQIELVELISVLIKRGWIDRILPGDGSATTRAILNSFDLSKTKKAGINSDINSVEGSFNQTMKQVNDNINSSDFSPEKFINIQSVDI